MDKIAEHDLITGMARTHSFLTRKNPEMISMTPEELKEIAYTLWLETPKLGLSFLEFMRNIFWKDFYKNRYKLAFLKKNLS